MAKIIDVKRAIISYHGVTGKDVNPMYDWYNVHKPAKIKYGSPWCAIFLAFALTPFMPYFPMECSCDAMKNEFKKRGQWREPDTYLPKPGDIVFFSNKYTAADCTHVGFVYMVDDTSIVTYEGNTSKMVAPRIYIRDDKYIVGYANLQAFYD